MNQILEQLGTYGIVPVVVLQDAAKAEPLAEALCKGGLACAEVTFRTDAAEESIRIMSEKFPEMLVGAGTVLTTEQADRAVKAGAKFIVSPGLNPEVVKWCQAHEVPVIPGIVTPTEMEQAIGLGLTMVKFFPAEPAGGLKYIRAIAAPYTMMKFMPTGGINPQNVREYLAYDRIAACGGSWMVKNTMIENNEFDRIEELVKEALKSWTNILPEPIGMSASWDPELIKQAGAGQEPKRASSGTVIRTMASAAGHRPLTSSVIRDGEETRRATARTLC